MTLLGTAAEAPGPARAHLMALRETIRTATDLPVSETTKWGQHAIVPPVKSGTPVRLHWTRAHPERVEMLVHCGTDLVGAWRDLYGQRLTFAGNRAVHFQAGEIIDAEAVAHMAAMAFTYKAKKKGAA